MSATYGDSVGPQMAWTEETLRARMLRMVENAGIKHRKIAEKLGVHESWVSRWLHPERVNPKTKEPYTVAPITVKQMNLFDDFLAELAREFAPGEETQREAASASTAGRLQRSDSPDTPNKSGESSSH